ncbi:MAG: cell division protein, partial [Alphaproteobacteria bacterium]
VRTVEPLSANKTRALIEPWLGRGAAIPDLPLPRLIDVRIEPGAQVPSSMLAERASAVVPGATVDDHASWAGPVITLVNAIKTLALAVAGVTGATAIGTTIFVTRMRLDIHRDVVELLHIMGARNATIAHQFAAHAGRLALMGGIMGVLPAIFILFGLGQAAGQIEAVLVPQFSFSLWQWFAIIALPVVAALLAMLTAQITTLAALRRMP